MANSKRTCSVDGCNKPHYGRGYCSAHYQRLRNSGNLLSEKPVHHRVGNGKPLEYFHNIVLPYEGNECLIWPFTRVGKGYAQMGYEGRKVYVQRLACEHVNGPAPTHKHEAAHSCGRGREGCVNPRHLRWATPSENNADKIIHGTTNRGERQGCAKLTEDDVCEIQKLLGTMPQHAIAQRFGVNQTTISKIKRGKKWRHLKAD